MTHALQQPDLPEVPGTTVIQPVDLPGVRLEPLHCPVCRKAVRAEDMNLEKSTVQCPHCFHVFGYSHDPATGQLRPELLQPEGVEILKLRHELDIRLRWMYTTSSWSRKFFVLFTTVWNLLLLPFVLSAVFTGEWIILLFISLHLLIGVGLMWYLLGVYFNATELSVSRERIRLRSGPFRMPWRKETVIDPAQVDQLYVSKYTEGTQNGSPRYAYALYALMRDGEKIALLRGMNEATQKYLEREVEGFVGIADRPVSDAA